MQHLLKEVRQNVFAVECGRAPALICGVGLGGYWAERIGFVRYPSGGFNEPVPYEKTWRENRSPGRICGHRYKVRDQLSRKNRDRCLVITRVMTKRWTANAQRKRFTVL